MLDADATAVFGAEVIARNIETEEAIATTSGDGGEFVLRDLEVGHYVVTISAKGFSRSVVTNVPVIFSGTTTVNVTLEVGQANVEVQIVAGRQLIETQNTSTQATIKGGIHIPITPKSNLSPHAKFSTPRLRQYFPETLSFLGAGASNGCQRPRANKISAGGQHHDVEAFRAGIHRKRRGWHRAKGNPRVPAVFRGARSAALSYRRR